MPTYLCHGFRWHRQSIRHYIARYDIEDGATEWVVAPRSEAALVDHLYSNYDFIPTNSGTKPPSYRKHHHAPSRDSSYVSRTSSSEYHGVEEPSHPNGNGNGTKATSRGTSRQDSELLKPRTSERDESTPSPSLPAPPLLSPSSINTKNSDYFPYENDNPPAIKLLEEFDPKDETMVSGPWAYVADHVVRVDTSVSIADEMFRYEARMKRDPNKAMQGPSDEYGRKVPGGGSKKAGWLEKLRDQLQRGESIRWYVVVCGDEERYNPTGFGVDELLEEDEEEYEEEECEESSSGARSQDRTWLRQSHSTQSTDVTTMTGSSVISGGFEFRIPELAGLAARTPTVLPERKRNKLLAPPVPQGKSAATLSPPPKSPLPPEVAGKNDTENQERPRTSRSTMGIRKLFSRQKSETSV